MIRQAAVQDIPEMLRIYDAARAAMRAAGNPTQWSGGYPAEELLRADIARGVSYVLHDAGAAPYAAFVLIAGDDPTYEHIENGAWRDDTPYATLHRVGSDGSHRGTFRAILDFARTQYSHLRADTHEDNHPMQHLLCAAGFVFCGTIYVADGTPRRAYEWIKESHP